MAKPNEQPAGFTLFAFAWAMAGLFHQFSFEGWRWYDVKGIALTIAVVWVLFKPTSWKRFAVLLTIDWVSIAWTFPEHPNHIVFSWVVNSTLLASLLIVVVQNSSETDLASRWYRAFSPWVRIELCVLYFFTVFHKLNISYFDIDWSCSAKLHREISNWMPLLPGAEWAQYMGIYGTLIIETAIPILLFFSRTRVAGVILGMLFHGLLALHPHPGLFSFSSTMTALFTVFIPLGAAASLQPPEIVQKLWKKGLLLGLCLLALLYLLSNVGIGFLERLGPDRMEAGINKIGFLIYYVYLFGTLYLFVRSVKTKVDAVKGRLEGEVKYYPLLVVFPLLLIVNGSGPYLGLRTQTSFSMFSNLHTENGMTNHLIVPSGIQLTNWQYDLVEIIDSNDPYLNLARDNDLSIVYLELRRRRSIAQPDFWVTFRREGRIETFNAAEPETHHILAPLGLMERRYFYFRPVETNPFTVRCKH